MKRYHVSKNLFDKDNINYYNGYFDYTNNKIASYPTNAMLYVPIERGKTYTISGVLRYSMSINQRYLLTKNIPVSQEVPIRNFSQGVSESLTFTAEENENYLCVMICGDSDYSAYGSVDNAITANSVSIMLNTGSSALPYEPYGNTWETKSPPRYGTATDTLTSFPATVIPDGTNASADIIGNMSQSGTPSPSSIIMPSETGDKTANLFDSGIEQGTISADGYKGPEPTRIRTDSYIILDAGTYTITADNDSSKSLYIFEFIYSLNDEFEGRVPSTWTTLPYTFTLNAKKKVKFVFCWTTGGNITPSNILNIMLNSGSSPLPYQPYGYKIPILSGGVTTPVYLGQVASTRRIKKVVLTGEEAWVGAGSSGHSWRIVQSDIMRSSSITEVCDGYMSHYQAKSFRTIYNGNDTGFGIPVTDDWITVCDLSLNTIDEFKTFLQQQYSAGTPVTVWYVLATETTGIVNEPLRKIGDYADSVSVTGIPTTAGSQQFDVDTTLKPSEVDLTYHGWHRKEPKERVNGDWE